MRGVESAENQSCYSGNHLEQQAEARNWKLMKKVSSLIQQSPIAETKEYLDQRDCDSNSTEKTVPRAVQAEGTRRECPLLLSSYRALGRDQQLF